MGVNSPPQPLLLPPSVIGPLDPGEDPHPKLFPRAPGLGVEDVVLQQAVEGLHGRVVPGSAHAPHRSDQAVVLQSPEELCGAELGEFNRW